MASETCALDIVGAEYVRDVAPGEMVKISADGVEAEQAVPAQKSSLCMFEFVYFARPDSEMGDCSLYEARHRMGAALAVEAPVEADMVMGVPDSGIPAAVGFAQASGVPYGEGLAKNRYVGRTFISPSQTIRQQGIKLKLNPLKHAIRGKRLIVVDDSIVRGNTTKKLVALLREAGAVEVHMRITSPPVVWPCFYGIDTDTQEQLIASRLTRRGDRRAHRRRLARVPLARRDGRGDGHGEGRLLPRMLRRRVPDRDSRSRSRPASSRSRAASSSGFCPAVTPLERRLSHMLWGACGSGAHQSASPVGAAHGHHPLRVVVRGVPHRSDGFLGRETAAVNPSGLTKGDSGCRQAHE